jgi:hypothetical protein
MLSVRVRDRRWLASPTWAALWLRLRRGDPKLMRRLNGWFTLAWVVMVPISIATGWIHSVTYVAVLSLWALVAGHWAAWQAARVEVAQEREHARREADPVEERIVHRFLEELGQYLKTHAAEIEDAVLEAAETGDEAAPAASPTPA